MKFSNQKLMWKTVKVFDRLVNKVPKARRLSTLSHHFSIIAIKACVRYFLSNFYFFTPDDSPLKTMKNVFYFI